MAPIGAIKYYRVAPRWLFVTITYLDGRVGWGEATLEGHSEAVEGCLDAFAERFRGSKRIKLRIYGRNGYRMGFYRGGPVLMSALSGVNIALWDLTVMITRELNVPIYEQLGGQLRSKLKVYAWIGGDRPHDIETHANVRAKQGFTAVKMNATEDLSWLNSPAALDSSVERPKKANASGLDVAVDFHGRLNRSTAKQLGHKLEPYESLFIEEPLLSEHVDSGGALSKLTTVPLALGERLHSRWDFKPYFKSSALDIIQPDICHVDGISELHRIATGAEEYDVAVTPHCPLGPIALDACIQVDAVIPNFAIQETSLGIHYNAGSADITSYIKNPEVWNVQEGFINLMRGPGLGIEVDEDQVIEASLTARDTRPWRCGMFRGPGGELREW
ncbi:hypothetical protein QWA68_015084 [Fusarium oxysporum]|nr:hypothetical protein QWA68_015084 [Fusarium oxysporum]